MPIFLIAFELVNKVFAQRTGNPPPSGGTNVGVPNPLGTDSIIGVLNNILNFLILIGAPIVAIMWLWGGFQMMSAAGDEEKYNTGKKTLLYSGTGYAIVLISKGIAVLLYNLLSGK